VSLLATLAAALTVDGDACISRGAPTSAHIVAGRWVGCLEQPQPKPQPFVSLPRLLDPSSQLRLVHGASVAQGRAAQAMSESEQR
jgi:hypothetical protein